MTERQLEICIRQVFSNPFLLKEILKQLEFKDLLNSCSLVDKKWNAIAREVLRESGSCLAAVEDGYDGSDWAAFHSVVAHMTQSPFSGLSIHLDKENHRDGFLFLPQQPDDQDDEIRLLFLVSKIMESIQVEYIKIGSFMDHSEPLQLFGLGPIFQAVASTLKALTVEIPKLNSLRLFSFTEFFGLATLRGQWLPRLKRLEFVMIDIMCENPEWYPFSDRRKFIQELLLAAPNLQSLKMPFLNEESMELVLSLPHKPFHVVKEFEFNCELDFLRSAQELAALGPQFRKLRFSIGTPAYEHEVKFDTWREEDRVKVRETLEAFLLSSQDSLEKLSVEHHEDFLVMMSQWNVPVLSRVKFLKLNYNESLDKDGVSTLEKINFSNYFPQLRTVSILEPEDQMRFNDGQINFYARDDFTSQTKVYSCPSVTTLHCAFNTDGDHLLLEKKLGMCRRMFPNVKHLRLEMPNNMAKLSTGFWKLWPDLETLHFMRIELSKHFNFDSLFLGLQNEEARRLVTGTEFRGQEELLQIVPTSGSIMNLKNLRRLSFDMLHCDELCSYQSTIMTKRMQFRMRNPPEVPNPYSQQQFLFSSLTEYCAFARMPGLEVEMCREACVQGDQCYLYLSHMGPFVKFVDSIDTSEIAFN